jgi:hypothetical protein
MTLICKDCKSDADGLINELCWSCYEPKQKAWTAKMAIRQDPAQFNIDKLVRLLLTQHWMHECIIIPDYMPPYPNKDTRPTCQVQYVRDDGQKWFLRYSNGPLQGYFWDSYGENMHSPELALIAISQASAPTGVNVIPTHGR